MRRSHLGAKEKIKFLIGSSILELLFNLEKNTLHRGAQLGARNKADFSMHTTGVTGLTIRLISDGFKYGFNQITFLINEMKISTHLN